MWNSFKTRYEGLNNENLKKLCILNKVVYNQEEHQNCMQTIFNIALDTLAKFPKAKDSDMY